MLKSKFFLIMSFLTLVALGASVAFQYMEMTTYGLDKEIIKKLSGGDSAPIAPAPAADAAKPESTDKPKAE